MTQQKTPNRPRVTQVPPSLIELHQQLALQALLRNQQNLSSAQTSQRSLTITTPLIQSPVVAHQPTLTTSNSPVKRDNQKIKQQYLELWSAAGEMILKYKLSVDNLPPEIAHLLPTNVASQSPHLLAVYCFSKAIRPDGKADFNVWCNLGESLGNVNVSFADLPQEISRLLPPEAKSKHISWCAIYCLGKELSLYINNTASWCLLGTVFSQKVLADLPQNISHLFPPEAKSSNGSWLTAYCFSKAFLTNDDYRSTNKSWGQRWLELGRSFQRNLTLADLSPEMRRQIFSANAETLSRIDLTAYCCIKALCFDDKNVAAWETLSWTFKSETELSIIDRVKNDNVSKITEQLISALENKKPACFELADFCSQQAARYEKELKISLQLTEQVKLNDTSNPESSISSTITSFKKDYHAIKLKFSELWIDVGKMIFNYHLNVTDLPLEIASLLPVGTTAQNPYSLAALCFSRAWGVDERTNYRVWNTLAQSFLQGASFIDLQPEIREFFPAHAVTQSPAWLTSYCFCKALSLYDVYSDNIMAWCHLGESILCGISLDDLLPIIFNRLPKDAHSLSPSLLAAYCFSTALNNHTPEVWIKLGRSILRGFSFIDLAEDKRKRYFPANADTQSPNSLAAYCFSRALGIDSKDACTWSDLGETFKNGAKLADVFGSFQKSLLPALKNKGPANLELAYFCYQEAQRYCTGSKIIILDNLKQLGQQIEQYQTTFFKRSRKESDKNEPETKRRKVDASSANNATQAPRQFFSSPNDEPEVRMEINPVPLNAILAEIEEAPQNDSGFTP